MFRLRALLQEQDRADRETRTEIRCQVVAGMLRLRAQVFQGQFTRTDVFCVASCAACRVMMEDTLIVEREAANTSVNAGQMQRGTGTKKLQCMFEK